MEIYIVIDTFTNREFTNDTKVEVAYKDLEEAKNALMDLFYYYRNEYNLYLDESFNNSDTYMHLVDNDDDPEITCELEILKRRLL